MKAKFMVSEHKKLPDDKGFIVELKTPFGETLGSYVPLSDRDLLKKYEVDSVHVIEVYPYKDKEGTARLGVRLEKDVEEELF